MLSSLSKEDQKIFVKLYFKEKKVWMKYLRIQVLVNLFYIIGSLAERKKMREEISEEGGFENG